MKRLKEQIKYVALLAVCLLSGCSDFLDSYNPSAFLQYERRTAEIAD